VLGFTAFYGADLADIDEAIYPDSGALPIGNPATGTPTPVVIPLDVVAYGGLQQVGGPGGITVANGSQAALIPAPPAGSATRIHSWSINGPGPAGLVTLNDSTSGVTLGTLFVITGTAYPNGQLCTNQVKVINGSTVTIGAWATYDSVRLPAIS
jgi:hypothetical protein